MTRLLDPAVEIEVEIGPEGQPGRIVRGPMAGGLEPLQRWMVEVDWWLRPVAREYWKVLLGGRWLCEMFHDLNQDAWFLERVYD